jgi:5-methylcytosine-specific restriction endonuclease McrA
MPPGIPENAAAKREIDELRALLRERPELERFYRKRGLRFVVALGVSVCLFISGIVLFTIAASEPSWCGADNPSCNHPPPGYWWGAGLAAVGVLLVVIVWSRRPDTARQRQRLRRTPQAIAVLEARRRQRLQELLQAHPELSPVAAQQATKPDLSARRREPISQRVRNEVWTRDGGRCVDCGSRERLEYDHIIPVSRGGSNTARNIELRCEQCNRKKGARI